MSELYDRYSPKAHIERLEAELEAANRQLDRWRHGCTVESDFVCSNELEAVNARAAIDDLIVQCKFWRQAAEHAVKGWNALEDRVSAGLEALGAIEGNVDAVRELLGSADEWAPPDIIAPLKREMGTFSLDGNTELRVVEEEKPVLLACGHESEDHRNARNYLEGAAEGDGPVCSLGWPAGPRSRWP